MTAMLNVKDLRAYYGQVQALHGLSFSLNEGSLTTLLGANGAGKTTTLRAICNMVRSTGAVEFDGKPIGTRSTENNQRADSENTATWYHTFVEHMPDWFVAIFTGLLAIVTYRLVSSTNKLWDAGERQLKLAADTSQRQLRAYVFLQNLYAVSLANGSGQILAWRIHAVWRNSGRTPTKFMLAGKSVLAVSGELPADFDYPDLGTGPTSKTFIGAGAEIDAGGLVVPMHILTQAKLGQHRLYMWGWTDYSDVFENQRRYRSEFCSEIIIDVPLDRPSGEFPSPFIFNVYGPHNGMDEECFRQPKPHEQRLGAADNK